MSSCPIFFLLAVLFPYPGAEQAAAPLTDEWNTVDESESRAAGDLRSGVSTTSPLLTALTQSGSLKECLSSAWLPIGQSVMVLLMYLWGLWFVIGHVSLHFYRSVGFVFIFGSLIMLLVWVTYIPGALMEQLICANVRDPETTLWADVSIS